MMRAFLLAGAALAMAGPAAAFSPAAVSLGLRSPAAACSRGTSGAFETRIPHHAQRRAALGAPLRMQANPSAPEAPSLLRKFGVLAAWAAFGAWIFFGAPRGDLAVEAELLKAVVSFPPGDAVSPVYVSVFALLGVWPVVFASLLLPMRPKEQSLPLLPFAGASLGLGFGGIGPYLALTSYDQSGGRKELEGWTKGLCSRGVGAALLASTFFALLWALGVFAPNNWNGGSDYTFDVIFSSNLDRFAVQFSQYLTVNAPSVDFMLLWLMSSKPLYEDMKNRGWMKDGSDKTLFGTLMSLPLFGVCLWLAVRPDFVKEKTEDKAF